MDRRKFITIASGAVLASSSGCLGYELVSASDINERKDKIEGLESEVSSKENRIENIQDELESIKTDNKELETRISELETQTSEARAKQILWLYSYGITHYNNGIDAYNEGYQYFSNGDYSEARAEFNLSGGYLNSAEANFLGAKNRASDIDEDTVESYSSDAENKARLMASAVGNYQQAVYQRNAGRDREAQNYLNQGDNRYSDAQGYDLRDLEELESSLGVTIGT